MELELQIYYPSPALLYRHSTAFNLHGLHSEPNVGPAAAGIFNTKQAIYSAIGVAAYNLKLQTSKLGVAWLFRVSRLFQNERDLIGLPSVHDGNWFRLLR